MKLVKMKKTKNYEKYKFSWKTEIFFFFGYFIKNGYKVDLIIIIY
jgi:hypothetical protein